MPDSSIGSVFQQSSSGHGWLGRGVLSTYLDSQSESASRRHRRVGPCAPSIVVQGEDGHWSEACAGGRQGRRVFLRTILPVSRVEP